MFGTEELAFDGIVDGLSGAGWPVWVCVGTILGNNDLQNETTEVVIPVGTKGCLGCRVGAEHVDEIVPHGGVLRFLQNGDPFAHIAHLRLPSVVFLVGDGRYGTVELFDSFKEGCTNAGL